MVWLLALLLSVAHGAPATPVKGATKATSTKAATPAVAWPTPVTLTTADGVSLQAVEGVPAKSDKGVVFVHMAGRNKEDWDLVAEAFYRQGMMVHVLDLRGHGANVVGAPVPLQPADYAAMTGDVRAAVASLRARGAQKIALVGAELGANLALNVAAEDPAITSVALLSPGLDVKGVITPDAVKRYGARSVLFVASKDDPYGARSAAALDAQATGDHRLVVYDAAGKGTKMFNREPELQGLLLGFVNGHWVGTATAAAPRAPTTVDIEIKTSEIKTTGPQEDVKLPAAGTPTP